MRYLIVADRQTAERLVWVLDRADVHYHVITRDVEAEIRRATGSFDAVLLQWDMVGEAPELIDTLSGPTAGVRPYIVAIVGREEEPVRAVAGGANDVLVRPLCDDELFAKIFLARSMITSWTLSQALQEKVDLADVVLDHIEGIVLVADRNGSISFVSASCRATLGYTPGQLLGDGWWRLAIRDRERVARVRDYLRRAIDDPREVKREPYPTQVVDAGGETRWFLWRDARGPEGYFVGFGQDVTRRVEAERGVRESEKKLRMILDHADVPIFVKDRAGRYLIANPATANVFGVTVDALEGKTDRELLHLEQAREIEERDRSVFRAEGPVTYVQRRTYPTGERSFLTTKTQVDFPGIGPCLISVANDISERVRAEEALRESEARYAVAAAGSRDGIWDLFLDTQQLYLSPRWKELIGYGPDEFPDDLEAWLNQIHPRDRDILSTAVEEHLEGRAEYVHAEYRIRARDRSYRWVLTRGVAVRNAEGNLHRMSGSQTDIHDQKTHDPLTRLANDLRLRERIERALDRSGGGKGELRCHLYLIGLNRFSSLNESLGHRAGDYLLVEVGRRLMSVVSPRATVARLGGDRFAVLEEVEARVAARALGSRIAEAIGEPVRWGDETVILSASVGIAPVLPTYVGIEDKLLHHAETAYRRARAMHGKTTELVYFEAPMQDKVVRAWRVRTALFSAIHNGQFRVFLQPIVGLGDKGVVGYEALLRWKHPELGFVSPGEFIPAAEESGQIVEIGRWVLEVVCELLASWTTPREPDGPLPYISVNLSAYQLRNSDVCSAFRAVIARTGVDPTRVRFEITETALLDDFDVARAVLEELHAIGSAIMLDDFGTGYSSLSYIGALPLHAVKLDRSFIVNSPLDQPNTLLEATIHFLQRLSLDVVAEGIETVEQAEALARFSCKYGQGYLFARPAPAREVLGAEGVQAPRTSLTTRRAMVGD